MAMNQEAEQALAEVRAEGEIECAHCGDMPDGVLIIKTNTHNRDHRICNECANKILRWL